jgi:hypothetical protein
MIAIFAVVVLRVTNVKIRLTCTRTFLQLYALLFMAHQYLYLSQQKYQNMLPLIVLLELEIMRNFSAIQKVKVHNCSV